MARTQRQTAAERFGELFGKFSEAIGEIMEDPELRKKAREFSRTAIDAAARVVESKVRDEEMRSKFRNVGKAAETLSKSLEENFKTEHPAQ